MNHSATGKFIRGGQTTQHWYRMAMQVVRYAIYVMLSTFTIILGLWCYAHFDSMKFVQSRFWVLARINAEFRGKPDIVLRVPLPDGQVLNWTSNQVYRSNSFRNAYYDLEQKSVIGMVYAGQAGLGCGFIAFLIFAAAGRKLGHDEHVRGAQLVTVPELKAFVDQKWKDLRKRDKEIAAQPRYSMGGLEFPPDALQAQTGIFGTTGAGKSTLIKDLIRSIRASGGYAVIYDRSGDYTASFYDEERDFIVNPLDERSHCWSPFFDADTPESFAQLYEVLIPTRAGDKDPFWSKSARIVAEYLSRELVQRGTASNAKLREALMNMPIDKLAKLVQSTPAEKFVGADAGKMGSSVYATMLAELRFLEFLRDDGPSFSARNWVKSNLDHYKETVDQTTGEIIPAKTCSEKRPPEEGSFVFLTGHPEMDAATRNITSAIMELAANALMSGPEVFQPTIFFIIDELASLNRLPFLIGKLAEVRKVGGCFVVGFQVLSQIEDIYGREGATTVMGNLNNTFFGSTPDEVTAEKFSKALGMVDQIESRENISVGATETRDGVGFIKNRFERRIATSTQIMKLPQFHCYATFAYDSPTALLNFRRGTPLQGVRKLLKSSTASTLDTVQAEIPKRVEGLVPYTGTGFATGSLDPAKFAERAFFSQAPVHKHAAEFGAWLRDYEGRHMGDDSPQLTERDKRALWSHYAESRLSGLASDLIGPPTLGRDYAVTATDAALGNPRSPLAYDLGLFPAEAFDTSKVGPRIIVAGSATWSEESRLWDLLDKAFHKQNNMVLCHKGMKGAEIMAAQWALARRVPQIVFGPKFDLHGIDAPDLADEAMMDGDVLALMIFDAKRQTAKLRELSHLIPRAKTTDFKPQKRVLDLPDYPLSDSPREPCATPAAVPMVDTVPSALRRRTEVEGTTPLLSSEVTGPIARRRNSDTETCRLRSAQKLDRSRGDLKQQRQRKILRSSHQKCAKTGRKAKQLWL